MPAGTGLWLFPLFIVYLISGIAETNRAPFDVAEGESEIVAGFHVEYSGAAFATLFALPEYANMILISGAHGRALLRRLAEPVRWLPVRRCRDPRRAGHRHVLGDGFHWLCVKIAVFLFIFLWVRATFPRYRYDQIMRLGWKVLIPITLVWIAVEGVLAWLEGRPVGGMRQP